jgi:acyl-CoA synthetase (AMP-forming)/AMP-acid ligase II
VVCRPLTKSKRPREIAIDQLPRTSVGKIRKFLLGQTSIINERAHGTTNDRTIDGVDQCSNAWCRRA